MSIIYYALVLKKSFQLTTNLCAFSFSDYLLHLEQKCISKIMLRSGDDYLLVQIRNINQHHQNVGMLAQKQKNTDAPNA